jgi:hypothetical protein
VLRIDEPIAVELGVDLAIRIDRLGGLDNE